MDNAYTKIVFDHVLEKLRCSSMEGKNMLELKDITQWYYLTYFILTLVFKIYVVVGCFAFDISVIFISLNVVLCKNSRHPKPS